MARSAVVNLMTIIVLLAAGLVRPCQAQKTDSHEDDHFDVRSSVGDLHLGSDADAQKVGLPLYPGSQRRNNDEGDGSDPANVSIFTQSFGFKLVLAKYESDDAPGKVIDYYRNKLKKYGKVLECHTREHDGEAHAEISDDKHSKDLKCDGDNTGPVTELKVGTEDNQHVVAVESKKSGNGTNFALVYVYSRGKQGDI